MPNLPEDILDRIKQIERRLQRTATAAASAVVSPWQPLPLAAGLALQSTLPQYRIQGPLVVVRGDATVSGGLTEGVLVATLPPAATPTAQQVVPVVTPNTTASYAAVNTDGTVVYHGPAAAWIGLNFVVALG